MEEEDFDQFYGLDQLLMEEVGLQHQDNNTDAQNVAQVSSRKQLTLNGKRSTVDDILSTLQDDNFTKRLKKRGKLRVHTSTNHPALSDNHKVERLQWVLSHLTPATPTQNATFEDMHHVIHIDEKWFYLSPETRKFYLLPKEEDLHRLQQSKRFKIKVMFMAVIRHPIRGRNGVVIHDGKYGIFPFVVKEPAKKSSKNRQAGNLVIKAIQNVNKDAIREMLFNKVIPAIISKWPSCMDKNICIQWDNARPHKIPQDEEFLAATTQQGFNITMKYQPPQSPDLNVLDLGLFNTIQSIQYEHFPNNVDELTEKVEEAFTTFDANANKYIWLSLQSCMTEILKKDGGNNYILQHMKKRLLDRQGILPERLEVPYELVQSAVKYLNDRFRPSQYINKNQLMNMKWKLMQIRCKTVCYGAK
ncbi:uncharacterized protein LOC110684935 [Chenopodium quinoa]|uniref:uncharacterized protein LOC110684935 n=1 Tax=Chenopodium quinoa TaxID=63459 RepID=UPI000B76F25E|nr:uncharacterized protein LOC110684935 [Chenopodium quinoa]